MLCTCKTRGVEILYGDSSVFCLGLSHGILTGLIMTHRTIPSELLSLKQYRCPTVYYPFYKVGESQKRKTCKNSYRPYSTLKPIKINLKVLKFILLGERKYKYKNTIIHFLIIVTTSMTVSHFAWKCLVIVSYYESILECYLSSMFYLITNLHNPFHREE